MVDNNWMVLLLLLLLYICLIKHAILRMTLALEACCCVQLVVGSQDNCIRMILAERWTNHDRFFVLALCTCWWGAATAFSTLSTLLATERKKHELVQLFAGQVQRLECALTIRLVLLFVVRLGAKGRQLVELQEQDDAILARKESAQHINTHVKNRIKICTSHLHRFSPHIK